MLPRPEASLDTGHSEPAEVISWQPRHRPRSSRRTARRRSAARRWSRPGPIARAEGRPKRSFPVKTVVFLAVVGGGIGATYAYYGKEQANEKLPQGLRVRQGERGRRRSPPDPRRPGAPDPAAVRRRGPRHRAGAEHDRLPDHPGRPPDRADPARAQRHDGLRPEHTEQGPPPVRQRPDRAGLRLRRPGRQEGRPPARGQEQRPGAGQDRLPDQVRPVGPRPQVPGRPRAPGQGGADHPDHLDRHPERREEEPARLPGLARQARHLRDDQRPDRQAPRGARRRRARRPARPTTTPRTSPR